MNWEEYVAELPTGQLQWDVIDERDRRRNEDRAPHFETQVSDSFPADKLGIRRDRIGKQDQQRGYGEDP